jgi:hypothetical protein
VEVPPNEGRLSAKEKNAHIRYIRNNWVRIKGVEDVRLADYLDRGHGTPEKPIVVYAEDQRWVEPTKLPEEAIRLLMAEYARQSNVIGDKGRFASESDSEGGLWTVSTTEQQLDPDTRLVCTERMVHLTCEQKHYKLLDAYNLLRRSTSSVAEHAIQVRGAKKIPATHRRPRRRKAKAGGDRQAFRAALLPARHQEAGIRGKGAGGLTQCPSMCLSARNAGRWSCGYRSGRSNAPATALIAHLA